MRRGFSPIDTLPVAAILLAGCFPTGAGSGSDGGATVGYTGPTLELTVNSVHFGPSAPDPGAYADLITMHDAASGRATGASFRLSANLGTAGCTLAFDRYGDGATIGALQYRVVSMQGASTLDGTVYPTQSERIATPEGGAGCTGTDCDGAVLVLSALDATHAAGYFQGTVSADSGVGQADAICSFWVKTRTFLP
ncbi:MAG: hypothetical protein JWN44_422 [Myxococcales bacterium]|nr:hypothetical protein [Myxococcales bacterium]